MIQPDTTPFTPRLPETCALCDGPLSGGRLCCPACVEAGHRASAKRQHGASVRPSDVLRERGME